MSEKEIALILKQDATDLENSNCQSIYPVPSYNDIDKCNFELLQNECGKLGFFICKTKDVPFDKRYYKNQYNRGHKYIIYTTNSISKKL